MTNGQHDTDYRQLVVAELKRLNQAITRMETIIHEVKETQSEHAVLIRGEIEALKVKATLMDRAHDLIEEVRKEAADHSAIWRTEIAALKVKSGVWGAVAGLIPALIALAVVILKG